MLVTVGSQLAPLVSEARLLDQLVAAARDPSPATADEGRGPAEPTLLEGLGLSPGIRTGCAYVVHDPTLHLLESVTTTADPDTERERLRIAREAALEEITHLSHRISEMVGENHGAILQAQLMILQDRAIEREVAGRLAAGCTAETALLQTLEKFVAAFQKLTNPLFQERAFDLKDVVRRLLWHLRSRTDPAHPDGAQLVLVAPEASVLDLFSIDPDRLAAVVFENGGPQCHAAILARSLGIPMVGQIAGLVARVQPGQLLRIDGTLGLVDLAPPAAVPDKPAHMACAVESTSPGERNGTLSRAGLPRIEANINLLCEVDRAVAAHAAGVGLYRTEFLFLARRTLPTEEEQVDLYRRLVRSLAGRPVSIRTFDLRPDKLAQCAYVSASSAPLYDWRRVLVSAPLRKLFKDQVRAILRGHRGACPVADPAHGAFRTARLRRDHDRPGAR